MIAVTLFFLRNPAAREALGRLNQQAAEVDREGKG